MLIVFFAGTEKIHRTYFAQRAGALGVISLTEMFPWLTQFDQHFALYVANAVKMFLFMTPLLTP